MATDADFFKSLYDVHTLRQALKLILDNEQFFGYDPYYAPLREAMLKMVERVLRDAE